MPPVQHSTMKRRKLGSDSPLELELSSTFATITDLPDELLAKIVEDLDEDETLFQLSLTCKRLNFLVLPTFFSRNGLKNPECGSFRYHKVPRGTLEAVRIALFVRNLSVVTFQFASEVDRAISEVSNLRGLLERIPPVGEISLGLPNHLLYWQLEPLRFVRDREVERWVREFLKLLGTIAERGCKDLELYDPIRCYPDKLYFVRSSAPEPTPAPADYRMLRSCTLPLKNFQASRKPVSPVRPSLTGMSTVKILSWKLFQPPFIERIIDTLVLNRGSIVCIHFHVTSISPALLSRLTKSLDLPAVKEVTIVSDAGVEWLDLRRFLDRHPSITSLCLDGIFLSKIPQYLRAPISLPYLTQLVATLPIVTWLLGCRNTVPLLTSVNVLLDLKVAPEFDDALQAFADHSHITSLRLTVGKAVDIVSLMVRHIHEDKPTRIIGSLNHIKTLNVDLDRNFLYVGPRVFKRWLYLFPGLEHVALDFRLLDNRMKLPAKARHQIATGFANQVAADRPMMKTLSINCLETLNLDELRRTLGFKDVPSAGSRKSNRVLNKKGKTQCSCK